MGILLQQITHFLFFLITLAALLSGGCVPGSLLGKGKRSAATLMCVILLSSVIAHMRLGWGTEFDFHWAFLAFWLVTPSLLQQTRWDWVHRLMVLVSIPGLIYSYYWMVRPDEIAWAIEKGFHMFPRAEGFVSNPITNAATLILIACWSFSRLTTKVPSWERVLIWAHMTLSVVIVVASRVRVGILGFLFLFLMVALFSPKLRKRALFLGPVVIILFLVSWRFFGFNMESIHERIILLKNGIAIIGNYPIFGIGPGMFKTYINRENGLAAHPHNTILGITGETGILGLAAYLVFMGAVAFALYRLYQRCENHPSHPLRWVVQSLILVYLTYWLVGLADYNFADTELLLANSVHFGVAIVLNSQLEADKQPYREE